MAKTPRKDFLPKFTPNSSRKVTQEEKNKQEMTSRMKRVPVTLPKLELKKP